MFGLSPLEMLVIGAVVAFVAGPTGLTKLAGWLREAKKAKSELTGEALMGRLLDDDEPSPPRRKRKRTRRKS